MADFESAERKIKPVNLESRNEKLREFFFFVSLPTLKKMANEIFLRKKK